MAKGKYVTYLIISEHFAEILFNFILESNFREKGHLPLILKICWKGTEISKVLWFFGCGVFFLCDSYNIL